MRLLINCFPSACAVALQASRFFPEGYQFDAIFYGEETHFIIALVTPKLVSYYYNGGALTGGIFQQQLPHLFAGIVALEKKAEIARSLPAPVPTTKQTSAPAQSSPSWLPKSLKGINSEIEKDEATPPTFSQFTVAPMIDFNYEARPRPGRTSRPSNANLSVTDTCDFLPELPPSLPKLVHQTEGLLSNETVSALALPAQFLQQHNLQSQPGILFPSFDSTVNPAINDPCAENNTIVSSPSSPTYQEIPSMSSSLWNELVQIHSTNYTSSTVEPEKETESLNTDIATPKLQSQQTQDPTQQKKTVAKAKTPDKKESGGRKNGGFFSSFYKNFRQQFPGGNADSASVQVSIHTLSADGS
jgi:hypothetical protein